MKRLRSLGLTAMTVAMALGLYGIVGCEKKKDDSPATSSGGGSVSKTTEPTGTIRVHLPIHTAGTTNVLNFRTGAITCSGLSDCDLLLSLSGTDVNAHAAANALNGHDDDAWLVDVGAVSSLGDVTGVPQAGRAVAVYAVAGHGYVMQLHDGSYARFYLNTVSSTTGADLSWQYPYVLYNSTTPSTTWRLMVKSQSNTSSDSSGTGVGKIISTPSGIDCGADCTEYYSSTMTITLKAMPEPGTYFEGWTGACSSFNGPVCYVTMSADKKTTALFETLSLSVQLVASNGGAGSVTSSPSGIDCGVHGIDCSETYASTHTVTLTATADAYSSFTGWGGACSDFSGPICTVTMTQAQAVTATFARFTLNVSRAGTGSGSVTSSPSGGIDCGTDCIEYYPSLSFSTITLTATPDTGSIFTGWSGDCSGQGTCVLNINANKNVGATFDKPLLTVLKPGVGTGSVSSSPSGITCGTDCQERYALDTEVTLTAAADSGSTFLGWSGACAGSGATCVVKLNDSETVTALFGRPKLTVSVSRNVSAAGGVVTSDVAGIQCGLDGDADCTHNYAIDTAVVLTASAAANSTFMGWTGDCSGTGTCSLTMSTGKVVGAVFNTYLLTVDKGTSTGKGYVTSAPIGLNCSLYDIDCKEYYPLNKTVTLTATADTGAAFAGWSGEGCSGTGTCSVTMHANKTVTAIFTSHTLTVTKSTSTGNGTVTSATTGINCDTNNTDCTEKYAPSASVTLTATADGDSTFKGWSGGGCSGTGTCAVTMDDSKTITAKFDAPLITVTVGASTATATVTTPITGQVGSVTGAVVCAAGTTCERNYTAHTVITITGARGNAASATWGGACSGTFTTATATCEVLMNTDKAVTLNQ